MPLGVIMSKKSGGECLAAKRTFVGRSPRPCERAEQAEPERFLFSDRKDDAGAASRGRLPPLYIYKYVS